MPLDNELYENYVSSGSVVSKGNFVSKKNFEVRLQIKDNLEHGFSPTGKPKTDPTITANTANISEGNNQPQCLWSNAAGATLKPEEFLDICRQTVGDADTYIAMFGMDPKKVCPPQELNQDIWKSKFSDGVGTIHYFQGGGSPWANTRHKFALPTHTSAFKTSGCGSTAMSIIFSTMMHKYITPAEMAAGIGTYNKRYGTNLMFHTSDASAGALSQSTSLELVFQDPKYNGQSILTCSHELYINKEKADAALDNGGMVMFVSVGRKTERRCWASGSGHWVVIREHDKSNDTYLCCDGANSSGTTMEQTRTADPNTANTFDVIQAAAKEQVFYVTPGPGYQDYINSLK